MKTFTHVNARSIEDACELIGRCEGKAVLNAGGTDLLTVLKGDILTDYPEAIINIKTVQDLDYVREEQDVLKIGALTPLSEIAGSSLVKDKYSALAEAADSVASPQIRNVATIGGNLCQDTRCWYYRYPRHLGGPKMCLRKGEGPCLAIKGDNRYHAIVEGKKCFAVCPSDTAVALAALDADIAITGIGGERTIAVTDFFHPLGNVLKPGEMVTEIRIPATNKPVEQRFLKFTLRKPIDFAVVSVAVVLTIDQAICINARIVIGAVGPAPFRATAAEAKLIGHPISSETANQAAEAALAGARPLSKNAYKIEIAKTLIRRAVLGEPD